MAIYSVSGKPTGGQARQKQDSSPSHSNSGEHSTVANGVAGATRSTNASKPPHSEKSSPPTVSGGNKRPENKQRSGK